MVNYAVSSPVRMMISKLAGKRAATLDDRMMCLLQLKRWLIDEERDDLKVFSQAQSAYATMRLTKIISDEMRTLKGDREGASPSCAVRSFIDDEEFLRLLDDGFISDKGFCAMRSFDKSDAAWMKRIDSVCKYIDFCLRQGRDQRGFKGQAYKLYDLAAELDHENLRKDIKPLITARRSRLSFVYVARRQDKWLFDYPNASGAMMSLLRKQTQKIAPFQLYFARCAFVQTVVAHGSDISGEAIAKWAGVAPLKPIEIEPISSAERQAAEKHFISKPQK